MSTIASPRDPSTPLPRRMASSQNTTTPTSSSRPSLETSRSVTSSPNPNANTTNTVPQVLPPKRNRAALREYYNLKKSTPPDGGSTTPILEVTADDSTALYSYSDVPVSSTLDAPHFDAAAFVAHTAATAGLSELLRTYARALGEARALDAEKKGLVYDNYSRLITATGTIRRLGESMAATTPMAETLDPAMERIYGVAVGIREGLRREVDRGEGEGVEARRKRTRELVVEVLGVPERVRGLVREGKEEEARREWEMPRRLLERWREKGVGGEDVVACIEDGDAALRGEDRPEGEM